MQNKVIVPLFVKPEKVILVFIYGNPTVSTRKVTKIT